MSSFKTNVNYNNNRYYKGHKNAKFSNRNVCSILIGFRVVRDNFLGCLLLRNLSSILLLSFIYIWNVPLCGVLLSLLVYCSFNILGLIRRLIDFLSLIIYCLLIFLVRRFIVRNFLNNTDWRNYFTYADSESLNIENRVVFFHENISKYVFLLTVEQSEKAATIVLFDEQIFSFETNHYIRPERNLVVYSWRVKFVTATHLVTLGTVAIKTKFLGKYKRNQFEISALNTNSISTTVENCLLGLMLEKTFARKTWRLDVDLPLSFIIWIQPDNAVVSALDQCAVVVT